VNKVLVKDSAGLYFASTLPLAHYLVFALQNHLLRIKFLLKLALPSFQKTNPIPFEHALLTLKSTKWFNTIFWQHDHYLYSSLFGFRTIPSLTQTLLRSLLINGGKVAVQMYFFYKIIILPSFYLYSELVTLHKG
jgi:hypothetical protein